MKMPKEKVGDLFMTILEYVNDKDPVVEDMFVDLVFEPIKHQLKRDLVKYEKFKVKQSQNGKLGGRPKNPNNPSLYEETQKSLTVTDTVKDTDTDTDIVEPPTPTTYEYKKRKAFEELFKRITDWDEETLHLEIGKFINKYPNLEPNKSGALINTWAANYKGNVISFNESVKKMII
jgi:hypothetical protein